MKIIFIKKARKWRRKNVVILKMKKHHRNDDLSKTFETIMKRNSKIINTKINT